MSAQTASLPWFAAHEFRLQWRDLTGMLTGGSPRRATGLLIFTLLFMAGLHWIADVLIRDWAIAGIAPDVGTLAQLTGSGLLFATMSLSQAMESVTRAYYTRHDLDLILSSPASARRLFAVRTGAIAVTSMLMMSLLMAPFINMLAIHDGPRWLAAYPVIAAVSIFTTALAIASTLALFRFAGARRTRVIAQILAAIVGAALIVGIQIAVIFSTGSTTGIGSVLSDMFISVAPAIDSLIWIPARAAMGDPTALILTVLFALTAFGATVAIAAPSFATLAIAATGLNEVRKPQRAAKTFASGSQAHMMRRKEWLLLIRDPWLISQSLMQLLYLLPPAALLWLNYGNSGGTLPIVIAIITMAAAQLSGGLAWLTISGEDAHDLVLTAPLTPRLMLRAKIEAVVIAIGVLTAPFIVAIALIDLSVAVTGAIGITLAASAAIFIQLMFRVRAKRSQFARRQTASRVATIVEALTSITWAGATGLAAVSPLFGLFAAIPAVLILLVVWLLRRKANKV